MFLAGLAAAISIKLSSSIDDVVWLAPFLTSNVSYKTRVQNSVVYVSVCLIQTVAAMIIAYSGDAAVSWLTSGKKDVWSTEKILTVVAGGLLALYTVKLAHEYFTESDDDEDEGGDERPENPIVPELELGDRGGKEDLPRLLSNEAEQADGPRPDSSRRLLESKDSAEGSQPGLKRQKSDEEILESREKKSQQTLFVICFLGSVDDLTLFVPMLVGKGFTWEELIPGAIIAASSILLICLFIGLCKPIADCLSSIPVALIVGIFATSLLVRGFMME